MMNASKKIVERRRAAQPTDIVDAIEKLTAMLDWLDSNKLALPAIDVNNAIERLKLCELGNHSGNIALAIRSERD